MIRVCRGSDSILRAEALEHRAERQDHAIAELECTAEHLAGRGLIDEADRLRSAARHLRLAARGERLKASRLRREAVIPA